MFTLQKRSHLLMTRDWLIALAGLAGSAITVLITALVHGATAEKAANVKDLIQFRADLLSRVTSLESDQQAMQKELNIWKERYWALYGFVSTLCSREGIPIPKFHETPPNAPDNED